MKPLHKYTLLFLLCLSNIAVFAQRSWTLQASIDTAMANNYGISISRNEALIAINNSGAAAAGMLPVLGATGSVARASNDIHQVTSSGVTSDNKAVRSDSYSGKVALSWVFFDGAKMFATYDRLNSLKALGELNVKRSIAQTLADVNMAYAELQLRQEVVRSLQATTGYYADRKNIAEHKFNLGNAAKTEVLSASVDYMASLNQSSSAAADLRSAILQFNQILQVTISDSAIASDSLMLPALTPLAAIVSAADTGNADLRERLLMDQIAKAQIREQKSNYFPSLSLDAGYTYSRAATEKGFFLENRTQGPSAGLSMKWMLFDGMTQQRQIRNAKLAEENAQLEMAQVKQSVAASVNDSWQQLSAAITIANRAAIAESDAHQNLDIVMERFRLNQSTVLEQKDAQRSWENAKQLYLSALYAAKLTATRLDFLCGKMK